MNCPEGMELDPFKEQVGKSQEDSNEEDLG